MTSCRGMATRVARLSGVTTSWVMAREASKYMALEMGGGGGGGGGENRMKGPGIKWKVWEVKIE